MQNIKLKLASDPEMLIPWQSARTNAPLTRGASGFCVYFALIIMAVERLPCPADLRSDNPPRLFLSPCPGS